MSGHLCLGRALHTGPSSPWLQEPLGSGLFRGEWGCDKPRCLLRRGLLGRTMAAKAMWCDDPAKLPCLLMSTLCRQTQGQGPHPCRWHCVKPADACCDHLRRTQTFAGRVPAEPYFPLRFNPTPTVLGVGLVAVWAARRHDTLHPPAEQGGQGAFPLLSRLPAEARHQERAARATAQPLAKTCSDGTCRSNSTGLCDEGSVHQGQLGPSLQRIQGQSLGGPPTLQAATLPLCQLLTAAVHAADAASQVLHPP